MSDLPTVFLLCRSQNLRPALTWRLAQLFGAGQHITVERSDVTILVDGSTFLSIEIEWNIKLSGPDLASPLEFGYATIFTEAVNQWRYSNANEEILVVAPDQATSALNQIPSSTSSFP